MKKTSKKSSGILKSAAAAVLVGVSIVQPETIPLTGLLLANMYGKGTKK